MAKKKKQKNATPSREQQTHIRSAGLDPRFWVVLEELEHCLTIQNRFTGEVKTIRKAGGPVTGRARR